MESRCDADDDPSNGAGDDGLITAERFDRGEITKILKSAEGFITVQGQWAQPGVLKYPNPDGTIRKEFVPPEVLSDQESLDSYAKKPTTFNHPTRDGKVILVDPSNARRFSRGHVGDTVTYDGRYQTGELTFTDGETIRAINSGVRQLSPGYKVTIDPTPGNDPIYGPYDVRQTRRVGNHVALTPAARGGSDLQLRADSRSPLDDTGGTMDPELVKALLALGVNVEKIEAAADKLDKFSIRGDADDDENPFKKKFDALKAKFDALFAKTEEDKGKFDALQAKCDAFELKEKDDAEEAKRGDSKADQLQAHKDWMAVHAFAVKNGVEEARADSMDVDELKLAVVKAAKSDLDDDATGDYVNAYYDILIKQDGSTEQRADEIERHAPIPKPTKRGQDPEVRADAGDTWGARQDKNFDEAGGAR